MQRGRDLEERKYGSVLEIYSVDEWAEEQPGWCVWITRRAGHA